MANNNDANNKKQVKEGAPSSTQVIKVSGNTIPTNNAINTETGGQAPNQPITQKVTNTTQPPQQSGGGPEGPAIQTQNQGQVPVSGTATGQGSSVDRGVGGNAVNDPNNVDIDQFISESTSEVKVLDEKLQKKKEVNEYLTKAIDSLGRTERIVFTNSETQEFIGTKFRYVEDADGKTIYDYMNDEKVKEYLEFVVPEDDPQDGSPVNAAISFYWVKPTF